MALDGSPTLLPANILLHFIYLKTESPIVSECVVPRGLQGKRPFFSTALPRMGLLRNHARSPNSVFHSTLGFLGMRSSKFQREPAPRGPQS
jgi:hypothetical protein